MFDKLDKLGGIASRSLFLEPGIYLEGNRELMLENVRRIEECSDVFMQLTAGRLSVQIWGSDMRAYDYRTSGLVIRGKISRIELCERSGK